LNSHKWPADIDGNSYLYVSFNPQIQKTTNFAGFLSTANHTRRGIGKKMSNTQKLAHKKLMAQKSFGLFVFAVIY
jgi:hypothetical protein